jgi:hypothetical protein
MPTSVMFLQLLRSRQRNSNGFINPQGSDL